MSKKTENEGLKVEIKHGRLVISIGTKALAESFELGPGNEEYDESIPDFKKRYKVTDHRAFAKEVLMALDNEDEDGSSLVTDLLDKACEAAIDDGADGIEEADEDDDEEDDEG